MDFHLFAGLLFTSISWGSRVGGRAWTSWLMCRGQRTSFGNVFIPFTTWIPGVSSVPRTWPQCLYSLSSPQPLKAGLYFSASYTYPRDLQGNNKIESPFPSQTHHNDIQSHDERTTSAQEYQCFSNSFNGNTHSPRQSISNWWLVKTLSIRNSTCLTWGRKYKFRDKF